MSAITYEWDIEETDGHPTDPEVLDHGYADTLQELVTNGELVIDDMNELCLVRTDYDRIGGREWAYVTEAGGLPEFFEDALGVKGTKVPKKFRAEFDRLREKIRFDKTPAEASHEPQAPAAPAPRVLKKGRKIKVYSEPEKPEGLLGVGTLNRKESDGHQSFYPQGIDGHERRLELWSVDLPPGRRRDFWVSADDLEAE